MPRKRIFCILFLLISFASAQFYFGRNKIQYEQFDWRILKTDHFHIYYYQQEGEIAGIAAQVLEDSYRDLEVKFNHTLWDTVPLIIYGSHIHFQQTNILPMMIPEGVGGFFEHRKGRVVIPYLGDLSAFRNVLTHELAHVFTFSKMMTPVRMKLINSPPAIPHWFSEGLAEWWSVGWDTQSEMVIRDRLVNGTLVPLSEVGGYLSYKEGQAFLRWFQEQYGIERIRRLMEDYWIYQTFQECLEHIAGLKFQDLHSQWLQSLRHRTADDLAGDTPGMSQSSLITSEGVNIFPVTYLDSRDQRHVVYLSSREGFPVIYQHPLYSENQRRRLARSGQNTNIESVHFLESGMDVYQGEKLVIAARSNRQDVLQVLDLDSGKITATYGHDSLVTIRSPRWSPDGKKILFGGQDFSGRSDIFLLNIAQDQIFNLTNDIFTDRDPSFDPTGANIVFSSDRIKNNYNTGLDLFMMELSSGNIRLLLKDQARKIFPSWSKTNPDKIHYLSDRSGMTNIWSLSRDEVQAGNLTLRQETDFHTGISQFQPLGSDSAVAGVFKDFSYQVAALPLDSIAVLDWAADPDMQTSGNWPPRMGQGENTRHLPFKLRYRLDFAQTSVAMDPIYGILGGAQLSLSDQLGNRYFHFLLANSAQTQSDFVDHWNVAVTYLNMTRRTNWGISVFHFANEYFSPYEAFYFERTVGLRGAVNFPYSLYRRLELSSSMWYAAKDNYIDQPESSLLVSNFISTIHDNALWSVIGPRDGWRARFTIGPTFDLLKGRYHNFTAWLDVRRYWQVIPKVTLAHRTMVWMNDGRDIRRYYIGGSWGMRGYKFGDLRGRKIAMLNQELRFPFAQRLRLDFRSGSIWLAPIHGALFLDVGNAWEHDLTGVYTSAGFGLRGALVGALVLRLDMGIRSLQVNTVPDDKFIQFFFGWDF